MKISDKKIENVLNFYMLANNLKNITHDKEQSIANQVYGAMILATAINSEYESTKKLGKILRMILLGTLRNYFNDELNMYLENMNNGLLYTTEICEYFNYETLENKDGRFAFSCMMLEQKMTHFFEEHMQTENIEELYIIAKKYGIIDKFGNDEKKNYEIFKFYYLNITLKIKIRSGWDSTHWNISCKRQERIAEHIVGTIALAIAFYSEFAFDVDLDKVISTLCIHEIGEIDIGDYTPFDGKTSAEKAVIEHEAWKRILCNLTNYKDMYKRLLEFDDKTTDDGEFAYYCDKLEADIQSKIYQDMGYHHPLTEQKNNIVFKSSRVQKMLEDGAKTAFDIWYEYDKPIYQKNETFTKVLKYVKDNNLKR